jgi:hypothetical protein
MNARTNVETDEAEHTGRPHGWDWLRVGGVWLFGILAVIAFGSYVIVRWVERQVLTTDNWVALVSPLPKQQTVADALGAYITNQVIDTQDIETRIGDALPPRAGFLTGPLASQVSSLTTKAAQKLVASDGFQSIWEGANRIAMNRLLATARGQAPPLQQRINQRFDINISQVGGQLAGALGTVSNAVPALQPASQKLIDIRTDLHARPKRLQQVVRTTDTLYAVLPLATSTTLLAALALARKRRVALMAVSVGVVLFVLSTLIALKLSRNFTLDKVRHPENLPAISYIFDTITAGLRSRLGVALLIVVVLFVVCLLAGPYGWARKFQSMLSLDKLSRGPIGRAWNVARKWTSRFKYYLWLAAVLLVLGSLVLIDRVTSRVLVNSVFLLASLWAAIYIFGTPRRLAEYNQ